MGNRKRKSWCPSFKGIAKWAVTAWMLLYIIRDTTVSAAECGEAGKAELCHLNFDEASILGATSDKRTIKEGETYQHQDDLTLSFLPKNANVVVKGGSVVVKGDVGEDASIKIQDCSSTRSSDTMIFSSQGSSIINKGNKVRGNVINIGSINVNGGSIRIGSGGGRTGGSVVIEGGKSCDVTVEGDIKRGARISAEGAITSRDVGEDADLSTENAAIRVQDVGVRARLTTSNAPIRARTIGADATLTTSNAGIEAGLVHTGAALRTSNARVRAGHVDRGASISTSNADIDVDSAEDTRLFRTSNARVRVGR
jgi:hypothetical protein